VFAFFAPETVKFVEMRSGILTFVCAKKRLPGSGGKVRFALQKAKPNTLDLNISVISSRPCESGKGVICVAHVLEEATSFHEIEATLSGLALRADLGISARRSPRLPITLRVMSRDLPGYGAVTLDLSLHGVRLSTSGACAVGTYVRLILELDVGSLPPKAEVNGKVIWCRPEGNSKTHFLGVEFCDLDGPTIELLNKYNKVLNSRLGGDVMHKTIADGEVFTRPTDNQQKAT
jgi:Tfp pilus assembly protein PilZ